MRPHCQRTWLTQKTLHPEVSEPMELPHLKNAPHQYQEKPPSHRDHNGTRGRPAGLRTLLLHKENLLRTYK